MLKAQLQTLEMSNERALSIFNNMITEEQLSSLRQNNPTSTRGVKNFLKENDYWIKLLEDVFIFYYHTTNSRNFSDLMVATATFVKLRSNTAIISSDTIEKLEKYAKQLFQPNTQGVEEWYTSLKYALSKYEVFKESPVFTKVYKLITYAMAMSIFDGVGLPLEKFYTKIESEAIRKKYNMGPDFIHCLLSTLTFLIDRGAQCMKTGNMDPLFHSSSEYDKFFELYARLKRESSLLCNPSVHGIDVFTHYAEVKDAIEKGEAILKYSYGMDKVEKRLMSKLVNDIKMLDAEELTKRNARASRSAPFAVSVFGASSIGKSTFTEILFMHFGKLFNLPTQPEFKYTRNANAKYWDGFSTYQWCLNLDDIAFMHPDIASAGGDPSLMELIMAINQTCFVPDQADLADKGRTPMKCDLVIASTNTPHLNAHHYYSCPIALMRRLPFLIDLKVKEEFADSNGMLDSTKVPIQEDGAYMDVWEIELMKIVNVPSQGADPRIGARGKYVSAYKFTSIYKFLKCFGELAKKHRGNQAQVKESVVKMQNIELCKHCDIPTKHCICEELQSDDIFSMCKTPEIEVLLQEEVEDTEPKKKFSKFKFGKKSLQTEESIVLFQPTPNVHAEIQNLNEALERENDCWTLFWSLSWYDKIFTLWYAVLLMTYIYVPYAATFLDFFYPKVYIQRALLAPVFSLRFARTSMNILGARIQRHIGVPQIITAGAAIAVSFGVVYGIMKTFSKKYENTSTPSIMEETLQEVSSDLVLNEYKVIRYEDEKLFIMKLQGDDKLPVSSDASVPPIIGNTNSKTCEEDVKHTTGRMPKPTLTERINPWFKDAYTVTPLDITPVTKSFKGNLEGFDKNIERRCAYFTFQFQNKSRVARATNVKGHYWLFNMHCVPPENVKACMCNYMSVHNSGGVSNNFSFLFSTNEIFRYPEQDLAIVHIPQLPPGTDITHYFCEETLKGGHKGYYMSRDAQGYMWRLAIENIQYVPNCYSTALDQPIDIWCGYTRIPTVAGQCGSLLISQTREGPVILGIHVLGEGNSVGALRVTRQFLEANIPPCIDGSYSMLSSETKEQSIEDLGRRCPLRWLEEGSAVAYGTLAGFRNIGKSHVMKSLINEDMVEMGFENKYTAPVMGGWKPWHIAIKDMVAPAANVDSAILNECVLAFTNDILKELPVSELEQIMVYDDFTAINGAAGVAYVDKMNMKSSMGFPWRKSKKAFIQILEAQHGLEEPVTFTPEIMNRCHEYERRYKLGERVQPIFAGCLKDEPVSLKKAEMGKTRVFTCAPGDWSIVVRKYCLAFTRIMQRNTILFEAAPGTIAQSTEWERLYHFITKYGKDRMVAGDYKAFDKSMPAVVIKAAFQIIYNVCKAAGYTEDELRVVEGISEDTAFPIIDMNGDLCSFYGSNPSGHPLTVVINSLANALYMRYAYMLNGYDVATFKDNVALMTYGDDNVMSVSATAPNFNHTTIQNAMKHIGITYTMADKESESIPYIHIDDISFLKRKWVWDSEVDAFLAPLEMESIIKSLMINVVSDTITQEQQLIEVVGSAMREFFFHGRVVFEHWHQVLFKLLHDKELHMYIKESTFPSFDMLKTQFWNNSKHLDITYLRTASLQGNDIQDEEKSCEICESTLYDESILIELPNNRILCTMCILYQTEYCADCETLFQAGTQHVC